MEIFGKVLFPAMVATFYSVATIFWRPTVFLPASKVTHRASPLALALGLVLALCGLTAAAADKAADRQDDKAAFAVLSIKDGLPNASVSGIIQDSKGFIWAGTQGGLARYDGNGFRAFENEPFDDNSISGDLVQTLYLDSNDIIWIGTYNGLNRYDIAANRFTRYRYAADRSDSLSTTLS
jgi:ligand-binding sensor domain-containing protein